MVRLLKSLKALAAKLGSSIILERPLADFHAVTILLVLTLDAVTKVVSTRNNKYKNWDEQTWI